MSNIRKYKGYEVLEKYKTDNYFIKVLLEAYPEDVLAEMEFTEEDIKALKSAVPSIKHGAFAELPITCKGNECPYKDICPLLKVGKAPVGHKCPIELAEAKIWADKWITGLEVDKDDVAQIYLVKQLVELELLQSRINKKLSMDGFVDQVVTHVDPITGKVYFSYVLSAPMELKLKLQARIDKILKSLVATREDKLKYGIKAASVNDDRVYEIIEKIKRGEIKLNGEIDSGKKEEDKQ